MTAATLEGVDLTKTNQQIDIEQQQAEFDAMEVSQASLDHMTPENHIRAMILMKEDIQGLTNQLHQVVAVTKVVMERMRLAELALDLIMRADPQMAQRIMAALPPEDQAEAQAIIDKAGSGAAPAAPLVEFKPGGYL